MDRNHAIESVAIVGAGAMGAAYAAMFTEAGGFTCYFVAQGDRYQRMQGQSIMVNDLFYSIAVKRPEDVECPPDLLIVALKHHQLHDALPMLAAVSGEQTVILSVMNGLGSEEIIGEACGMEKMVYAIAVGIDAVREKERFSYAKPGKIIFGGTSRTAGSSRVQRLQKALALAGIPCEIPEDIMRSLWWKFMINVGINQASAVLRSSYGLFQTSAAARKLMVLLMEEVIEVAGREGIDLGSDDLQEWLVLLDSLTPGGKTSMLQDIEAGRKTEVEIFAGAVVEMGAKHGLAVPVNAVMLHTLQAMEDSCRLG